MKRKAEGQLRLLPALLMLVACDGCPPGPSMLTIAVLLSMRKGPAHGAHRAAMAALQDHMGRGVCSVRGPKLARAAAEQGWEAGTRDVQLLIHLAQHLEKPRTAKEALSAEHSSRPFKDPCYEACINC